MSEAMYIHGVLNVAAFGILVSSGISKQVVLTMKYTLKQDSDNYMKYHKQRHTFVNALAMVPAYAALYIGQRARNNQELAEYHDIVALTLWGLIGTNFFLWVYEKRQKSPTTALLAWSTGALSVVSTVLLVLDNPGPSITHHYLGITTIFMYQAIILRFFVNYGYHKKFNNFEEGKTVSGLIRLVLIPLSYLEDFYNVFIRKGPLPKKKQPSGPVLVYYDHILWGFATFGVSLAAMVTGIPLYKEWYKEGDHQMSLYLLLFLGLVTWSLTLVAFVSFKLL